MLPYSLRRTHPSRARAWPEQCGPCHLFCERLPACSILPLVDCACLNLRVAGRDARGNALLRRPVRAARQAVEIEEHNGRRVQRQDLTQRETADDGIAERLPDLRSGAGTEHQRHRTQQSRHRGHQDRPEAQHAGLVDRLFRRHAVLALGLQGKIDQHDAVLLDDADQQDDADQRDHAQIEVKRHEQQERADARRWQGRKDRDRVDHAFVEHAQNEVDDDQRRRDQDRRARQRRLEGLGIPLEARGQRERLAELLLDLLDGGDRLTERNLWRQVVGDRHRRELTLVVDHQG